MGHHNQIKKMIVTHTEKISNSLQGSNHSLKRRCQSQAPYALQTWQHWPAIKTHPCHNDCAVLHHVYVQLTGLYGHTCRSQGLATSNSVSTNPATTSTSFLIQVEWCYKPVIWHPKCARVTQQYQYQGWGHQDGMRLMNIHSGLLAHWPASSSSVYQLIRASVSCGQNMYSAIWTAVLQQICLVTPVWEQQV